MTVGRDTMPHRESTVSSPASSAGSSTSGAPAETEPALAVENARLRESVEHMSDAYWAVDRDWCLIYVNAAAEQIWGRDRGDLLGKMIWDEFPSVIGTANYQAISRAMELRTVEVFEGRSPALDRWVSGRAYPTADGLAVHFQDITPRRTQALAYRQSEERYRAVLESIDEGFCVVEVLFDAAGTPVDYRFLEVNAAFEQQTGLHDAAGKRMRELAPAHEAYWFQIYGEVALTGSPVRFVQKARALGDRWFDVYAIRLGDAESRQVAIVFSDITQRKRAEADLALLAAIVEDSRDAILSCDLDGTIVNWNQGAEALFGYAASDIVGQDIDILTPRDHVAEHMALFEHLRQGESIPPLETVRIRQDGAQVDVEIRLSSIRDAGGDVVGISAIARDVTERKRLERLQQDFIAMASHDLAGPVTVLRARAQLMQRRQAYDEAGIETIIEQTQRMERLIDDLRELVQLETGQLELVRDHVDLVALAHHAAERARMQDTHRPIQVETSTERVTGHWDPVRLGQILDNLLGNAVKYSPPESPITVCITPLTAEAQVSVVDQGDGIAAEALPHLFERFYRAEQRGKAPGLGLGLYITRMLVEAHDGRVWAESRLGQGSTFIFVVPLALPA